MIIKAGQYRINLDMVTHWEQSEVAARDFSFIEYPTREEQLQARLWKQIVIVHFIGGKSLTLEGDGITEFLSKIEGSVEDD